MVETTPNKKYTALRQYSVGVCFSTYPSKVSNVMSVNEVFVVGLLLLVVVTPPMAGVNLVAAVAVVGGSRY